MAHITLAGTLRDPDGSVAVGDKIRFTHNTTTGETVKSAVSILTIDPSGVYSLDLEYGLVLVEYKDSRDASFKNLGVATVNATNPATSIPELLNAVVPVSSAELIEFQTILADCVAVSETLSTGVAAFATLALLTAYTPTAAQQYTSFKVTSDTTPSNNGYYSWSGSAYIKDAELVANVIDENNTSEGVSGAAVYDEDTKEIAKTTRYRGRKNLFTFNDRSLTAGFFIDGSGNFQTNTSYSITGYVEIKENETLINNWANAFTSCQLFNKDLTVLYTSPLGQNNLVWQVGAAFARFSIPNNSNYPQIEVGAVVTDYEQFTQNKPEDLINTLDVDLQGQIDTITVYENLFDKDNTVDGYLNSSGNFVSTVGYDQTINYYIELIEGQTIAFTSGVRHDGLYSIVTYDENKQKISADQYPSGTTTITGLVGSKFVRFTINNNFVNTTMIVYGVSTPAVYVPRLAQINPALLINIQLQIESNVAGIASLNSKYVPELNLFDKSATLDGKYIGYNATGTFTSNSSYEVSDFIKLAVSQKLTAQGSDDFSNPFGVYTYDINKNWLSTHQETSSTITGQTGSYYVRLTNTKSKRDTVQYEYGEVATNYEQYRIILNSKYLPFHLEESSRLVLPNTVYMKSNSNPSIYFDNIAYTSMKQPKTVKINLGDNLERQWSYIGRATDAITTITFDYKSPNLDSSYSTLSFNLSDIDQTQNSGKTLDILCIGDSFTDIGTWVEETKILLEADGVTVNLQGTKGPDTQLNESLSGGTMSNFLLNEFDSARNLTVTGITIKPSTGYPGTKYTDSNGTQWTATGGKLAGGNGLLQFSYDAGGEPAQEMPASGTLTYVSGTGDTTITYSSWVAANRNPLWNAGAPLDFAYYKSTWSFPTPDILALQFTFNDVGQFASRVPSVVANAKQIIDAFRVEYPTSKVVYSIEPCGARFNRTRNPDDYLRAFLQFVEAMKIQFEEDAAYNTWVIIAPSYAFVDLTNGYGPTAIVPSSRYPAISENYGGDGVHCNSTGMRQIADAVVPCIHKLLL